MIKIALCDDDSPFVCKITGLIQLLLQNSTDSPVHYHVHQPNGTYGCHLGRRAV